MTTPDLLQQVLQLWQQVLPAASLQPDTHFFLAGGDSLQLARLLLRVQQQLGVSLRLQDIGDFSTPLRMARVCASTAGAAAATETRSPEQPVPTTFLASSSQQGLWWSEQQAGDVGLYQSVLAITLQGELQVPLLAAAIDLLLDSFPLLAAGLAIDTANRRLMVRPASAQPRLGSTIVLAPESIDAYIAKWATHPLELSREVFRCQLLQQATLHHTLLLCVHHCVADGWSGGVLLQQLLRNYRGLCVDSGWQPAEVDHAFACYCEQQQYWRGTAEYRKRLDWWQQYLRDADKASRQLPWQPVASHWPYELQRIDRMLPDTLLRQLPMTCMTLACTPFSLFATALAVALHAAGSGSRPLIGFPFAGRTGLQQEQSIGCYMQLLPLWLDAATDCPLHALVQRNHATVQAVLAHALPLPDLVERLRPSALADGNAWFDVVLALQNFPLAACDWSPLAARCRIVPATHGQYALKLEIAGDRISVEYAGALVDPALPGKLLQKFEQVLAALAGGGDWPGPTSRQSLPAA